MSGKDHRDLMRTQVAVVAGGPNDISAKVTQATRAVVDCIYLAQYDTMTNDVLTAYENSFLDLKNLKQAWVENETRRGKRGDAYRATNRRNWTKQATQWLTRHETVLNFALRLDRSLGEPGQSEASTPEVFVGSDPSGLGDKPGGRATQEATGEQTREQNSSRGNKGKAAQQDRTINRAGAQQRVNVDASITWRTLAEVGTTIGESNLMGMIRVQPDIASTTIPVMPETQLDLWNCIRLQISKNPWDPLQRVRTAQHKWNKSSEVGPDPVFYINWEGVDPRSASVKGSLCNLRVPQIVA
ncbi:hypothetical protein BDV93DRAFT_515726 [Ceratobasidium sp. AG-I]|nr:hypothetical protein BDV93DRAFT_515726 [Ceratobasidium sp. AG-I]